MKCVECGKKIGTNHKFCKYCGAPIKQIPIPAENIEQTLKCKKCGAALKPGNVFCTQCGTPISAIDEKTADIKEKGKSGTGRTGKVLISFITVIVLTFAVFIGYYFARQYGVFDREGKEAVEADFEAGGDDDSMNREVEDTETEVEEAGAEIDETVKEARTEIDEAAEEAGTEIDEAAETAGTEINKVAESEEVSDVANTDAVDVENVTLQIENRHTEIDNGIASGSYDITTVSEGILAYSEQDIVKAIVVRKDGMEDDYAQNFYYDENGLFFAYYEASDLHRFYFNEGQLVRWQYSSDAADTGRTINYDMANTTSYLQWEQRVKDEASYLEEEWSTVFSVRKNTPPISNENIYTVDASSCLDESGYNIVHLPECVIDGDLTTGWVEGVSGQGIGETITIYFDGAYLVSGIEIYAGYQKSDELYRKNSRPKDIYIEFSDGSGESHVLNDVKNVQNIQFTNPIITESITLRIDSVYPGNKYEDTVITEISLY